MQKPTAVKDMHSGEKWPTISEAAKAIGVTQGALSIAIASHRACKGRWIVVDGDEPVLCECCKAAIEGRKTLRPNYGMAA